MTALPPLHHVAHGPADGTMVLAVHGWTPDHRLMTGCCEPVFDGRPYRRLYPDLPGMGRTPAAGVECADDVLACVEAFIDEHIGDRPFLLLGESYAGYLARAVAARRPHQVLGLALVCPVGAIVYNADRHVPEHQVLVRDIDVDEDSEFAANAVVWTRETLERMQAEIVPGLEAADEEALNRIRQRWELSFVPEDGPAFERPTLIVTGRQDASVGYIDQWALLEHYPRATFAVADAAGHNLQIERPSLFDALLIDWLERVEYERR